MSGFPLNALYGNPGACAPTCPPDPCLPCAVDPCGVPGNGLGSFASGANPFPAIAVSALQPYRAVKIINGGFAYASNDSPTDFSIEIGIIGAGANSGIQAFCTWGGPLTNSITGMGGWNWTLGTPIFLGTNGQLTQSAPAGADGFTRVVGFPLSANTMFVFPPSDKTAVNPTALSVVGSVVTAYAASSTWAKGALLADVTLAVVGGSLEGQRMSIAFSAIVTHTVTLPVGSFALGTFISPISVMAGTEVIVDLRYNATTSKWRVLQVNTGY